MDSASGMILETRERTFRMMDCGKRSKTVRLESGDDGGGVLLGSSSGLLSVLVLSTEAVAVGDRLPWNISSKGSLDPSLKV